MKKINLKAIKKKINKFTSKISFDWLYDKRVLLVISILTATVLWFLVTLNVSPEETKVIYDVPVRVDEASLKAKGLTLIDILDTQDTVGDKVMYIDVELEGNRYSLGQITKDDISVIAQVSEVEENKPGDYKLTLKISCTSLLAVDVTPNNTTSMIARLDIMRSGAFAIDRVTTNSSASSEGGYIMEACTARVGVDALSEVTISGPQSVIDRIEYVRIFVEGEKELTQTKEYSDGVFVLLDEAGNTISGSDLDYVTVLTPEHDNTRISDAKVTVRVPIKKTASLKVEYTFNENRYSGSFNLGKLRKLATCTPTSLSIKYLPANIDGTGSDAEQLINSGVLTIGKIDLASITPEQNVYTYTYEFASGIEMTGELSGSRVDIRVEFDLTGYTTKEITIPITESNFIYDKDGIGMQVVPQSESITIVFVGPKKDVAKLTADMITIVPDVSLVAEPGNISVPINVHVKSSTCWATGTSETLAIPVSVLGLQDSNEQ